MKRKITKISSILLIVLVLALTFSLSSCKKKAAPILPPESTFVFDDLSDDAKAMQANLEAENFAVAVIPVFVWTTISNLFMVIPVMAYQTALQQEPVHVEKNKWVWEYQFRLGFTVYTFQLYGNTEDDVVTWEMYISANNNEFEDFLWFYGQNNVEATAGYWILYKSAAEPTEFIRIDWTHNHDDNTGTIKYTNIIPGDKGNGSYIYYGNDQSGTYNAFYDIYDAAKDILYEIDYNTETHVGRVKNIEYYEDNNWHCWDENFQDIICDNLTK